MANGFKCEVRTSDYTPFVKKMIEADSVKYSNFNNVAAFVLSSPILTPEQKMLGLYNTALIFEGLAALDNTLYTSGKSKYIIGLSASLTDPKMFLSRVAELFPNNRNIEVPKTYTELIEKLNGFLSENAYVDRSGIFDRLAEIDQFLKIADYENETDRIKEGNAALDILIAGIKQLSDLNPKSLLLKVVENYRTRIGEISSFVPLSEIANDATLKTAIVSLPDGRIVEAFRLNGSEEYMIYEEGLDENGEAYDRYVPIPEGSEIEYAHVTEMGYHEIDESGNSFQHVFFDDTINSALKIITRKGSERKKRNELIIDELRNLTDPRNQVKITMKPVGNVGRNRVQRIKDAGSQSNKEAVARRNHETFETPAQENFLKRSLGGKILTLARPTQGYLIEGTILATGETFRLYSFGNYAFVHADNFTEAVDFSNLEHLQEIKRLSVNKDKEMAPLTDAEIQIMRQSNEAFQQFMADAISDLSAEEGPADITEKFFDHYSFGTANAKEKEIPLSEDPEFDMLMHSVPVVQIDSQGQIIEGTQAERKVPFFFTKQKGETVFSFKSSLAPNEKVITEDGRIIELDGFVNHLGIDQSLIQSMFSSRKKFLDATSILIKQRPDGKFSFRIMRPKNISEDLGVFGQYIMEFAAILNLPVSERRLALDAFETQRFSFKIYTPESAQGSTLVLGHSTDGLGIPRLRMRPWNSKTSGFKSNSYQELIGKDAEYLFYFPLKEDIIVNLAKAWSLQGKMGKQLISELKEAGVNLSQFDISVTEKFPSSPLSVRNFTRWLQDQVDNGRNVPSATVFLEKLEDAMHNFAEMLKVSVTDKLVTTLGEARPEILEEMKKHFSIDGVFHPEFLIVDSDANGKLVPKIRYHEKNNEGKEDYYSRISNYKVLRPQHTSGRFQVIAKGTPKNTISRPKVTTNPAAPVKQAPLTQVSAPLPTLTQVSDVIPGAIIMSNIPLELRKGFESESQTDRQTAIQWLNDTYSMFGLEQGNLAEILDLASVDGDVLGAFANKVIYLNDKLLGKGTVYHEAFHGVFRHLMNSAERRNLLDTVLRDKKNSKRFTEASLKEFAEARNLNLTNDAITDLVAEEILAEGFQSHMGKNSSQKPGKQGLLAKFFEMLKKIINMMVQRRAVIEEFYTKVGNGGYSKRTMQSGLFDNQVAYEVIPGIMTHIKQDGQIFSSPHIMDDVDQKRLVSMLAGMMVRDNPAVSFDKKFEAASKRLVSDEYNFEKLLADRKELAKTDKNRPYTPEIEQQIVDRYGLLFANYSFILGGRESLNLPDVNLTGDIGISGLFTANTLDLAGELIDNKSGLHSKSILKKEVAKEIATLSKMIEERYEEDDSDRNIADAVENLSEGGTEKTTPDGYDESNNELAESNDSEAAMNEFNRMDSLNRQLRMFLTSVRADVYDAELGVTVPSVINAERVFSMLLRISANVEPRFIIQNLLMTADQMREDGSLDVAAELYAIYNAMDELVALDSNGFATQNNYIYNMLVDVLHGTQEAMIMVSPYTKVEDMEDFKSISTPTVVIKDKILSNDTWVKKRNIISQMVLTQGSSVNDPAKSESYKQAVEALKIDIDKIKNNQFMNGTMTLAPETILAAAVDRIKQNLDIVGLNVPKSLIRLSLMAIHKNDFKGTAFAGETAEMHYQINLGFVQDKAYLEQDFWRDLNQVLTTAVLRSQSEFKGFLDDINIQNSNLNRFNAILGNASAYIVKYDPELLPSTVKNAEGKAVFRYTKYTAIRTIMEDVRKYGLEASLEKDPYWHAYLKNFVADNTWLNPTSQAQKDNAKLFLSKMEMALFGGVQQKINGVNQEGKGFKDLDDKSLYLSFILMFMDRKKYTDKTASIETFMRPYSQLEASQTHYVVSGLYKQFASKVGNAGTTTKGETAYNVDGKQYTGIVKVLEDTVRQEFARMQREYQAREVKKEEFDSGKSNELILKFNAILDENDKSVAVVDPITGKLRAYKFNKLDDFFTKQGKDLAEALQASAFEGKSFDAIDADLKASLRKSLQEYANTQFQNHIEKLESLGAVTKREEKKIPGKFSYTSEFIPDHFRYSGGDKVKLTDVYGPNGLENFLKDAFYNVWANSLMFNDIFDGDKAMSVKDGVDYFKRNKKHLAASSNMKEGYHRVAYTNTILGYVHEAHPEYGSFYSADEIFQDDTIPMETRAVMIEEFMEGKGMQLVFDGQSVSSIMHQMDMMESIGRLDDKSKAIMIAKHYRELTDAEISHLKSMNIVLNAKKTVTAARFNYHKLSEVHIDRNDVSRLAIPEGSTQAKVFEELQMLYEQVYANRKIMERAYVTGEDGMVKEQRENIKPLMEKVHSYFQPLPHRIKLHNLLNSMEYFQIDQMMDTEASKNATLLPMDLEFTPRLHTGNGNSYLNLDHSALDVENRFKYLQVETSGVKDKVKFSVQSKALLPADLLNIKELIIAQNGSLTENEETSFAIVEEILTDYQDTLRDVATSMSTKFKTYLRKDGDFDISKVYGLIRESLAEQNAPSNRTALFELTPSGEPKFSPNLPAIRVILEYYFFSQYSKNVTDEKGAGFKNIHISGYGYDVLVDRNDKVIPTHLYKADPSAYPNVRSRSLKTTVETDEKGVKTYFMEVMVPRPKFEIREHEKFYMEYLTKMFGTRVPTEDKRSMVALKVVDFIDSSNATGIIVPHAVHMLSGSDFDVDALYGQMKAFYKSFDDQFRVYGEYKGSEELVEKISLLQKNIKMLTEENTGISKKQQTDNLAYAEKLKTILKKEQSIQREHVEKEKFLEFINYFSSDKDLKPLIKERYNKILEELEQNSSFEVGTATLDTLDMLGHSKEEVEAMQKLVLAKDEYKKIFDATKKHFDGVKDEFLTLNSFISDILSEIGEEKSKIESHAAEQKELDDTIDKEERRAKQNTPLLNSLYKKKEKLDKLAPDGEVLKFLYTELKRYSTLRNEHASAKKDMFRYRTLLNAAKQAQKIYKIQATLDVLSGYGLPITMGAFNSKKEYGAMVTSIFQNKNLESKLAILSNEMVFKHLYINERSSVEEFEKIMDAFGLSIDDVSSGSNSYTMDGVIATKKTTSMNKDGIGITANLNKFLALASTYQLELKKPIWNFSINGENKAFTKFGSINEEKQRTIALIGNILGMFADGAKKPIPAALGMNEYNATITLAMIGVGLNPKLAVGFNFLPRVQQAVMVVQSSDTAIGTESENDLKKLNNELRNQMIDLVGNNQREARKENENYEKELKKYNDAIEKGTDPATLTAPTAPLPTVMEELVAAELISFGSDIYSGLRIQNDFLELLFVPQTLNKTKLNLKSLSPSEIGFEVRSSAEGAIPLSQEAQSLILLELYRQQAVQTDEMRKAGAIINLFKSLNPSFTSFDAMIANIRQTLDPDTSIFTEESVNKLKNENQVWQVLVDMMEDLDEQSQIFFMERSGFLGKLKELFETVISDPAEISQTMTAFVGVNAFLKNYPGSRSKGITDPRILEYLAKDDENLKEMFTPDSWFHSGKSKVDSSGNRIVTLGEELDEMKKRFPRNRFLNSIVEKKEVVSTYFNTATKQNEQITMNYLTLAGTSKKTNVQEILNDFNNLLNRRGIEEKLFIKKLFYHELARTALMGSPGSFMQFMETDLQIPISNEIEKFATGLKRSGNVVKNLSDAMGLENQEDLAQMFDNMFMQLVYKAVKNPKNKRIPTVKSLPINNEKVQNVVRHLDLPMTFDRKDVAPFARYAAMLYDQIFGYAISKNEKIEFSSLNFSSSDANVVKNGIKFNLKLPDEKPDWMTGAAMVHVAKQFGIKKSTAPGYEGQFQFPVVIRIEGGFLKLKQVGTKIPFESTGHAILDALKNDRSFNFIGMSANYEFLPNNSVPSFLNSIGFSRQASERFAYLRDTGGKRQGSTYTPVGTPLSQAPSQPAQKEQNTNSTNEEFDQDSAMAESDILKSLMGVNSKPAETKAPVAPVRISKMSTKETPLEIYADGNDFKGSGQMGYGAAFNFNGKWFSISGTENAPMSNWLKSKHPDASWSNPTTELMGTVAVLNNLRDTAEHVIIKQDFNGIVNWGELWNYSEGSEQRQAKPWKIKEPYIQTLHDNAVKLIKQIEANGGSVRLQWVKGHNGIQGNEIADKAAKNRENFNEFISAIELADRLASDMNNLNFTPEVLNAIYNNSTMSKTRDEFERQALQIAASLRATKPANEIIEQLKCL
jgi:ribonuclease HI